MIPPTNNIIADAIVRRPGRTWWLTGLLSLVDESTSRDRFCDCKYAELGWRGLCTGRDNSTSASPEKSMVSDGLLLPRPILFDNCMSCSSQAGRDELSNNFLFENEILASAMRFWEIWYRTDFNNCPWYFFDIDIDITIYDLRQMTERLRFTGIFQEDSGRNHAVEDGRRRYVQSSNWNVSSAKFPLEILEFNS